MPNKTSHGAVAIPADNRPEELSALLDAVQAQEGVRFDVLVVEDASPRQAEIRAVVEGTAARRTDLRIRFVAVERNLNFDGNLRRILELSEGELTLFMGEDDLLRPEALGCVGQVIDSQPNLGVVLRAYESDDYATGQRIELFRYFAEDRHVPAGARTMRTFFRRCVSIAGFTIHAVLAPRTPTLDSRYTQ